MKKVVILAGGWTEAYASFKSAKIVSGLLKNRYQNIDIVELDPSDGLLKIKKDILNIMPNLIVNLVHGYWGEDGCAQIFLEQFNIPYTGPNFIEAHASINKHIMRETCKELQIPIANGGVVSAEKYVDSIIFYPHIVKPSRGGSSYGVAVINNHQDKINYTAQDPILVYEEMIAGPELCIAIKQGKFMGSMIVEHDDQIYTTEAKNTDRGVRFIDTKKYGIEDHILQNAKDYALTLYEHLKGRGLARIDFKVSNKTHFYFIDYNSIPGMVLMPRILKLHGYSDDEILDAIL